jgi:hypothetical protein
VTRKPECRPAAAALFVRLLTAPATDGESAFEIATRFEKGLASGAPAKDVSKAIDFYWRALEAGNKRATPRLKQLFPSIVLRSGHYPPLLPVADKASWADVRSSPELPEDLRGLVDELQAHLDGLAEEPFGGDIERMRATAFALNMPNRTAYLRFLTPANVERMRRLYYHPYDRAVARRVGQEINDTGGFAAMEAVYYLFMWTTPYATASRRAGTRAVELFEQAKALAKVDSAAADDLRQQAVAFRRREMALLGYPKDVERMWDGIGDWREWSASCVGRHRRLEQLMRQLCAPVGDWRHQSASCVCLSEAGATTGPALRASGSERSGAAAAVAQQVEHYALYD